MSNSFERSETTRTQTMNVSDKHVLDGFRNAIEIAIEQAETALTYSHALADKSVDEAEQLFEQLAAVAMNGLGAATRRRNEILSAQDESFVVEDVQSGEIDVPSEGLDDVVSEASPLLLSLDDSARFLDIPREELVKLMDAGEFVAEFIGAELRLNMRDLDAYLQRNGAGRNPTPIAGTAAARPASAAEPQAESPAGLSDLQEDFDSIVDRLFDIDID